MRSGRHLLNCFVGKGWIILPSISRIKFTMIPFYLFNYSGIPFFKRVWAILCRQNTALIVMWAISSIETMAFLHAAVKSTSKFPFLQQGSTFKSTILFSSPSMEILSMLIEAIFPSILNYNFKFAKNKRIL